MSWRDVAGHEHVSPWTPSKTQAFNTELRRLAAAKLARAEEAKAKREVKAR